MPPDRTRRPRASGRGGRVAVAGVVGAVVAVAAWASLEHVDDRFQASVDVAFTPSITEAAGVADNLDPFHSEAMYRRVNRRLGRVPAFDVIELEGDGEYRIVAIGGRDVADAATAIADDVVAVREQSLEHALERRLHDRRTTPADRRAIREALSSLDDSARIGEPSAPQPAPERGSTTVAALAVGGVAAALSPLALGRRRAASA